jgi:aerobic-type carbon monoxide dehydrogenase small subunit (CoxS/CutS family)
LFSGQRKPSRSLKEVQHDDSSRFDLAQAPWRLWPQRRVQAGAVQRVALCKQASATITTGALKMLKLKINGAEHRIDVAPDTPLLWVIRENLGLTGTKFGCGAAQCGACTVLLDGAPIRSCVTPASAAAGSDITTIEGLATADSLHPVQQAWINEQVPQCGYCQSGQILAAVALLENNPSPSDRDIDLAMSGNICRCGMYPRIRQAINKVASGEVLTYTPQASAAEVKNG